MDDDVAKSVFRYYAGACRPVLHAEDDDQKRTAYPRCHWQPRKWLQQVKLACGRLCVCYMWRDSSGWLTPVWEREHSCQIWDAGAAITGPMTGLTKHPSICFVTNCWYMQWLFFGKRPTRGKKCSNQSKTFKSMPSSYCFIGYSLSGSLSIKSAAGCFHFGPSCWLVKR